MARVLVFLTIPVLALSLAVGCDDGSGPVKPREPVAFAGADTMVPPDSAIDLIGSSSTDPQGGELTYEWQIGSDTATFVPVSTGDTTIYAPANLQDDYRCVLRVTDDEGLSSTDTVSIAVTWLRSPHGGEVFVVGDSLRVSLFPVYDLVDVRLVVRHGTDDFRLKPPGANEAFVPNNSPELAYFLPDSIYDLGDMISTVSDSCKILVFRYNASEINCSSLGWFRIVAAN